MYIWRNYVYIEKNNIDIKIEKQELLIQGLKEKELKLSYVYRNKTENQISQFHQGLHPVLFLIYNYLLVANVNTNVKSAILLSSHRVPRD